MAGGAMPRYYQKKQEGNEYTDVNEDIDAYLLRLDWVVVCQIKIQTIKRILILLC
jgi:hypothetical protein